MFSSQHCYAQYAKCSHFEIWIHFERLTLLQTSNLHLQQQNHSQNCFVTKVLLRTNEEPLLEEITQCSLMRNSTK